MDLIMKKRTIFKLTALSLFLLILFSIIFLYKSSKYSGFYSYYDLISSKQTIKDSFKYKNTKEEKKLYSLYSDNSADAVKRELNNIKKIDMNDISLIQDEYMYSGYIGTGLGSVNNTQRKDLIIYKVNYNVEYYDDSTEPLENGSQTVAYFLVKNNGKWIITTTEYL